jgi:hypothetical protein
VPPQRAPGQELPENPALLGCQPEGGESQPEALPDQPSFGLDQLDQRRFGSRGFRLMILHEQDPRERVKNQQYKIVLFVTGQIVIFNKIIGHYYFLSKIPYDDFGPLFNTDSWRRSLG